MFPIWVIAKREFTENIISLRLLIGLIICLALFIAILLFLVTGAMFLKSEVR